MIPKTNDGWRRARAMIGSGLAYMLLAGALLFIGVLLLASAAETGVKSAFTQLIVAFLFLGLGAFTFHRGRTMRNEGLGLLRELRAARARTTAQAETPAAAVAELIEIYRANPSGFVPPGFSSYGSDYNSPAGRRVRLLGEQLNRAGGIALMRTVHASFSTDCQLPGAARNLEHVWDGIGSWQG